LRCRPISACQPPDRLLLPLGTICRCPSRSEVRSFPRNRRTSGEGPVEFRITNSIERAKEVLTDPDFQLVLDELSALVLRYRLHDIIGLRLLHKHNDIYDLEVMVEREEYDPHGHPCLSTVAVAINKTAWEKNFYPSIWALCPGSFLPLEFTTDASPRVISTRLTHHFLSDFAAIVKRTGFEGFIGPCAIPRQFYTRHRTSETALLVETTDDSRRANIVRFVEPDEVSTSRLVPTTWQVQRALDPINWSLEMAIACETQNCQPVSACVVDANNNHTSQSTHTSQHVSVPDPMPGPPAAH
jgi:hypothetical protein